MMHIEKKVEDRKVLVKRLGELLGIKPKYLFLPTYAYEIGDYTVTKPGALEVEEENANVEILNTLIEEGLIENLPETTEEAPAAETEEEPAKEAAEETYEPTGMSITLPIYGHSGATLRNLVNLLYQRASLINKATGAAFSVDKDFTELLQAETGNFTKERFLELLGENRDSIKGMSINETVINFTGFPEIEQQESPDANLKLVAMMNKQALAQKRIMPKEVNEENEKYAFRIWLIRIGMKGNEYKEARKALLKNLSGNCAFRTDEELKAFSEKQKAKRNAAKEAGQDELSEQTND